MKQNAVKQNAVKSNSTVGRKFWAFIISLVAVTVAAAFGLDITTGVATLFATYCIGNVGTKWVNNTGASINGVLQNKD